MTLSKKSLSTSIASFHCFFKDRGENIIGISSLVTQMVENLPATQGTWLASLGRSAGEGNSNPLQYSCLESPMDRGAWWATVLRVEKSQMQLATKYKYTSEILWAWLQTAAIHTILQQCESHDFSGFPMHLKVMFTLVCCLLSVR